MGKQLAERIIPVRDHALHLDTVLVAQVIQPPLSDQADPFNHSLWEAKHNGRFDIGAIIALDGILNTLTPGQAILFFNSADENLHEFLENYTGDAPED